MKVNVAHRGCCPTIGSYPARREEDTPKDSISQGEALWKMWFPEGGHAVEFDHALERSWWEDQIVWTGPHRATGFRFEYSGEFEFTFKTALQYNSGFGDMFLRKKTQTENLVPINITSPQCRTYSLSFNIFTENKFSFKFFASTSFNAFAKKVKKISSNHKKHSQIFAITRAKNNIWQLISQKLENHENKYFSASL